MMLLLDTHAFVWLASNLDELSRAARDAIQREADGLFISSVSALEIGILVKRGRLILPVEPGPFVEAALEQHDVREVPIDCRIALASAALPEVHNDPFDRIIIATAHLLNMRIVSKDRTIPAYPQTHVIW